MRSDIDPKVHLEDDMDVEESSEPKKLTEWYLGSNQETAVDGFTHPTNEENIDIGVEKSKRLTNELKRLEEYLT